MAHESPREAGEDADSTSEQTRQVEEQCLEHQQDRDSDAMNIRRLQASEHPDKYTPSFHDAVSHAEGAEGRPRDGEPRVKSADQLKPRYFLTYHSSRQHRLQKSFHRWQIQKERHNRPSSDDWRRVLALLENATPTGEEHFKTRLEAVNLPGNVSLAFKGNAGAAILEIMQRTGSHVQVDTGVLAMSKSTGNTRETFSAMNLRGTPQQNAAALKVLPQYVEAMGPKDAQASKDFSDYSLRSPDKSYWDEQDSLSEAEIEQLEDVMDQVTSSTDKITIPIRAVWAEDRLRRGSPKAPKHLLRRPEFLSATSLTVYVENLTQKLPRLVTRKLYGKQRPKSYVGHIDGVTQEFVSLFTDETVIKDVTAATLDLALHYLTKHSKYDAFRKIFTSLEHHGYEFASSNWNALLAAAAKAGDVFNFRYMLKLMLDRKAPPTPMAWALFHDLMSRRFPLEAGVIVETMRRKGLLVDNKAASLIAANSAGNELTAHLAWKRDLESFYRLYDNRFELSYGRSDFEWLNINVVNRMCTVLLAAGRVEDAFAVLEDYETRNRSKGQRTALETVTLNIFLTSAFRDADPSAAVAFLQRFRVSQPGAVVPDHVTYSILFGVAWRKMHYNMLRVIWRYACAAGHVGYSMQSRMRTSMFWQRPKNLTSSASIPWRQLWMAWAAKFAVGVHDGLHELQRARDDGGDVLGKSLPAPALSTFEASIVRLAAQHRMQKGSIEYDDHYREVGDILRSDFAQVQNVAPVFPFAEILEQAFKRDREWKEKSLGHPQKLPSLEGERDVFAEMMQMGIKVPLRVGDYTKDTREWEVPSVLFDKRRNKRA